MGLIKKATREKVKVKVLLMSPSGGGKTYTALRLAKGMGGRTLLIDTEARRGLYYADEFDYDYVELKEVRPVDDDYEDYKQLIPKLNEPFAPENYVALIQYAVNNGYDNLIIDSLTHEWNSKGGILDSLNKMVNIKNDMQKWAILTPRHNDFIYGILHSPINVIATVRGKDEYVLEQNANGKNIPKKVGLGAVQRDGMEYEYTVTFMLDQETNIATEQKDNTHLFRGNPHKLTEDDGFNLIAWANSGEATTKPTVKPKQIQEATGLGDNEQELLYTTINNIRATLNTLKDKKIDENSMKSAIKKHHKTANYTTIEELNTANKVLEELKKLEVK